MKRSLLTAAAFAALLTSTGCPSGANERARELNDRIEYNNQIYGILHRFSDAKKEFSAALCQRRDQMCEANAATRLPETANLEYQAVAARFEDIKRDAAAIHAPPGKDAEEVTDAFQKYLVNRDTAVRTDYRRIADNYAVDGPLPLTKSDQADRNGRWNDWNWRDLELNLADQNRIDLALKKYLSVAREKVKP